MITYIIVIVDKTGDSQMAKANQRVYHGGISPRTEEINIGRGIDPEAIQALDNLALNPVNRVGEPALGSGNTGHLKELPTNQQSRSLQERDQQRREQKRGK